MTEKRYSNGALAKWYYSQTNVISDGDNEYYLRNKESVKDLNYNELLGTNDLLDELNRLSDENEQLKKQLMENNCDNCKYSKAIYADVECRKKGLTEWKYNCDEFKGDVE